MHNMVPIHDCEGEYVERSLRSPILLPDITIVAALSAYGFCGFNGYTVNGEVACIDRDAGVAASSAKENALIVLAVLLALSALVLRGIFDGISSRR